MVKSPRSPRDEFFEYLETLEELVTSLVETHQEMKGRRCWWDNDIKCSYYPFIKGFKDAKLGCEHCGCFDRHNFFPLFKKIFWQFLEEEKKELEGNLVVRFEEENEKLEEDAEAGAFQEASAAIKEILEKESIKEILEKE